MAILSALFSFLGKKAGDILQAIFGWSVTALFGRLSRKAELAITVALIVSIAWPIFVVGVFVPKVPGLLLAFVPIDKWIGAEALRWTWIAIAVAAPLLVGAIVRIAAPGGRGSMGRALLQGYPLAVGFFASFMITFFTVPAVKIASVFRGWSDEHVFVQPKPGEYTRVLRELAEACARAGVIPDVTDAPGVMQLATNVLRRLARGALKVVVADDIKRLRTPDLELYLYPADLLIRGKPELAARVRAMMSRTSIANHAYLVESPGGQALQEQSTRLGEIIERHHRDHEPLGGLAAKRLSEIWHDLSNTQLPYSDFVTLEAIVRRLERSLVHETFGAMPLDRDDDALESLIGEANAIAKPEGGLSSSKHLSDSDSNSERIGSMATIRADSNGDMDEVSSVELVRTAIDETKALLLDEIALAKQEAKKDLMDAKRASIGFAIAVVSGVLTLCLLAIALLLLLGATPLVALAIAGGFLAIAGVSAYVGYAKLPKNPLERTRKRLEEDLAHLKEHIA